MDRHVCRQCGKLFNYCRACVLKRIPHKEAGFCSKECSATFKAPKIEIPETVEIQTVEVKDEVKPKITRKSKENIEPAPQVTSIIEMMSDTDVKLDE